MTPPALQVLQVLHAVAAFPGLSQVLGLQEIPLTMFHNSVDDQYIGCQPIQERELKNSGNVLLNGKYPDTLKNATRHWAKLGQTVGHFDPIYGTAIVAYTVGSDLYRDFNNAVREARISQASYDEFAFKGFHFLLTKALQAKKTTSDCYEVFRGIKGIRFTVHLKQLVRFGQFASSSLDEVVARWFGHDTLLSIKTCYGVRIHDFSYLPHQKEVLIPPYETFNVTKYSRNRNGGVFIRLQSQGVFSHFNCEVPSAAGLPAPRGAPFLLGGLLLTWSTLAPLGGL